MGKFILIPPDVDADSYFKALSSEDREELRYQARIRGQDPVIFIREQQRAAGPGVGIEIHRTGGTPNTPPDSVDMQAMAADYDRWKRQEQRLASRVPLNSDGAYIDPVNNKVVHPHELKMNESHGLYTHRDGTIHAKPERANKTGWLGIDRSPAVAWLVSQVEEVCSKGRASLNA